MKRVISILLALVMTLSLCSAAWAIETAVGATGPTEGTCGAETNEGGRGSVTWKLTKNGGKVAEKDENGNETGVILPAYTLTISGKGDIMDEPGQASAGNWAARDENGKGYGSQITQVIVKEGITGIGDVAFNRNLHRSTISIPASVTKIGKRAFGAEMIVTLAKGNTSFVMEGNVLFTGDKKTLVRYFPSGETVDSYTVPASVETIIGGAFQNAKFNRIDLGSVKTIGVYAFQGAEIPEIVLPESVTEIGEQLVNSAKVQKLVLNMNMAEMPINWLYGANVEEVVIGKHITKLNNTFKNSNIKKVTFAADSNVKEFVGGTFYGMKYLESIAIPDSVEKMGEAVFRGCENLKSVVIGAGIKVIPKDAFLQCTSLKSVTFAEGSQLEKIEDMQAFKNCPKLEFVELPDSCTYVGAYTFSDCPSLRTIVARGTKTQNDFKCNNNAKSDFYKATVSYGAVLRGFYKPSYHGIGMAQYAVNGVQATTLGWYTLEGDKGDSNSINGTSTTVYAVYKADCSFDVNGGTGDVTAIKSYVAPGLDDDEEIVNLPQEEVKIPGTTPTRAGYTFTGWNTAVDGSGDSYQPDQYLKTTNQPITKLYAQWGKEVNGVVYTVSCDAPLTYNGGKQTPTVIVKAGDEVLLADQYTVAPDENGIDVGLYTGTVTLNNVPGDEPTGNAAIDPAPVVVDNADAAADANTEGDADADADAAADADTDSDADANADAEVDANVDTEVENETENDAPAKAEGENGDAAPALKPSMSSAPVTLDNDAAGTPVVMANNVTIDFKYEIKKAPSALQIDAPATAKGNSKVTLTVSVAVAPTVTCSDTSIEIVNNGDGTYSANVPDSNKIYTFTVTDAGDANHEGATKSVTVNVTMRSSGLLVLEKSTLTAKKGETQTIAYTCNGDGNVTAESSDPSVATVTVDENAKTITVKLLKKGTADIVVRAAGTANYKSATAVLVLTVEADAEDNNNNNNNNGNTGNNGNKNNDRPFRRYPSATANGGNDANTANTGKNVKSGDTGDMGIALYAAAALLSATGMAWFGKKRGQ